MTDIIIYPNGNGGLVLVIPTGELPIAEVARKDVPAGTPYKFVKSDQLPSDIDFMESWEADFSNPDGVAIGAEAWFAEQAAKKDAE